jgi:hypothetical protein
MRFELCAVLSLRCSLEQRDWLNAQLIDRESPPNFQAVSEEIEGLQATMQNSLMALFDLIDSEHTWRESPFKHLRSYWSFLNREVAKDLKLLDERRKVPFDITFDQARVINSVKNVLNMGEGMTNVFTYLEDSENWYFDRDGKRVARFWDDLFDLFFINDAQAFNDVHDFFTDEDDDVFDTAKTVPPSPCTLIPSTKEIERIQTVDVKCETENESAKSKMVDGYPDELMQRTKRMLRKRKMETSVRNVKRVKRVDHVESAPCKLRSLCEDDFDFIRFVQRTRRELCWSAV